MPRFSSENFPKNLALIAHFEELGSKYDATPSQIALAWILAQNCGYPPVLVAKPLTLSIQVIPIPGTRAVARLEENAHSAELSLSPDDVKTIRKRVEEAEVHGARHANIPQGDCIELAEWKA